MQPVKYLQLSPSIAIAIFDTTTTPGYALAEDDLLKELLYDYDFISPGKSTRLFLFKVDLFPLCLQSSLRHKQVLFTLPSLFGHRCKASTSQKNHQSQGIPDPHRVICAVYSSTFGDCPTRLTKSSSQVELKLT